MIAILALAMVLMVSAAQQARAASTATVWTNKSDYPWFSTVQIYGSGFVVVTTAQVSVTDPNGAVTEWSVSTDLTGSFATSYTLGSVAGNYTVVATDGTNTATTTFHDAAQAANLDQCTNGPFQKGVVTPEPCLIGAPTGGAFAGTSFSNWVNGNANGAKAHWREGEFIAYRVDVTGLTAGAHTFVFHYDTVHSGVHALDYIGSYDYTETTALSSSQFHYNFNNPCFDLLGGTACSRSSPVVPAASIPIPAATLANCATSAGTPPATQIPGSIKAFLASGSVSLTGLSYLSQNIVSGTGQCSTTMQLSFTTTSGASEVVFAWGGHIATEQEWGAGNSASFISGSPYHMSLDLLDGASTGSQDRALSTTAIFFSPTIATDVKNAATGASVTNTIISAGTSVYDTATLTGASSNAGGTVSYNFFTNNLCSGTPLTNQSVNVANAIVPRSPTHGPLLAGLYSFNAWYSGDALNLAAKSPCEPFQVGTNPSSVTTSVIREDTSAAVPLNGHIPLGTTVHDTALVGTQVGTIVMTGTVTYHFFTNIGCTAPSTDQTVSLSGGLVPNSSSHGPLAAGSYSFRASYSGDSNYDPSTSACEPFIVDQAATTTTTALFTSTGASIPVGTSVPLGTSVYDTASVGPQVGSFVIGGTVTYSFFTNGLCQAPASQTFGPLAVGASSSTVGPLLTGDYSFSASYSGDSNYNPSTSACEPFHVNQAPTTIATALFTSTGNSIPLGSSVPLATQVHDLATASGQVGTIAITGNVEYFFSSGGCAGTFTLFDTEAVGTASINTNALAAGSYAFEAQYMGDANYAPSAMSACEPFTVSQGPTTTTTALFTSAGTPIPLSTSVPLSTQVYDLATVGPAVSPFPITGTVEYFFSTTGCKGPFSLFDTVAVGSPSKTTDALAAGSYAFYAAYSGDANYQGSTSACEPFTVSQGPTTTTTALFTSTGTPIPLSTSVPLSTQVYDLATVGPAVSPFPITGTVEYFFSSGGCGGTFTLFDTVAVGSPSKATNALAAGSYAFYAIYSGDANYEGSTSACEPFTVSQGPTTTTTALFTSTGTPIPLGSSVPLATMVHDLATVGPVVAPFPITGTVEYFFSSGGCGGTFTLFDTEPVGTASVNTAALATGSYAFYAAYSGDANYQGSTSACEPFTVSQGPTTTTTALFTSTGTPIPLGSSVPLATMVYDLATVGPAVPPFPITGTVTYYFSMSGCAGPFSVFDTQPVGSPSKATNALAAGSYAFYAVYSGDTNYEGSTSTCEPFTVSQGPTTTTTALFTSAGAPIPLGSSVPLATMVYDLATVGPAVSPFPITGTVEYFFSTSGCSGTFTLFDTEPVGTASKATGALAAGSYAFYAIYSGDSNYVGSTSTCEPFTVSQSPTTTTTTLFTSSGTPIPLGSSVPLATMVYDLATVGPAVPPFPITGTVEYFFSSNGCGGTFALFDTVAVGSPSKTTDALAAGSYAFYAVYSGDANYEGSTSTCEPFTVSQGPTTTTTALFTSSGTPIPLASAVPLATQVYDLASVGPAVPPFPITGTVEYFFSTTGCKGPFSLFDTVAVGSPSKTTDALAAGDYAFYAVYSGDANYQGSTSGCEPFVVLPAPTVTTTDLFTSSGTPIPLGSSVPLATQVYDLATVGPAVPPFPITGTVEYFFSSNGCTGPFTLFDTEAVGTASVNTNALAAGNYAFFAVYLGDANYVGSTSSCEPFTVSQGPTTTVTQVLDSNGNDVTGAALPLASVVHDLATVGPAVPPFPITGTVDYFFSTNGCAGPFTLFDTEPVGTASVDTAPLAAGSYAFYAVYSGDSNYEGSTGSCEPFTVSPGPTTTVTQVLDAGGNDVTGAALPLASVVHDLATVGPAVPPFPITGTVTYYFSMSGCAGPFSVFDTQPVGSPSIDTGPLAAGSYAFYAVYSGDANYEGSTGVCEPFTVNQGPTTTTTALFTSTGTPIPLGSSVPLATMVHDLATVAPVVPPFPITGNVQYFFSMSGCSGPFVLFDTEAVGSASVNTGALAAGNYAFKAQYLGDPNYAPSALSDCEPFTVSQGPTTTTTALFTSTGTPIPLGSSVPLATMVHDLATVGPAVAPFPITGTVDYFFSTSGCSGPFTLFDTEAVGTASINTNALAAGSYAFYAVYSGDANYEGSTSACEPFTVSQGPTTTTTALFTSAGDSIALGSSVPLATMVYDLATVGPAVAPFPITGTVTYYFSMNGCAGSFSVFDTVAVGSPSKITDALAAGSYAFYAVYSGDANYEGSTSACEPFTVSQAPTTTTTDLFTSTGTPIPLGSSVPLATMVHDLATVGPSVPPFPITGNVEYFFSTSGCAGPFTLFDTEAVGTASVNTNALAAGSYAFYAVYSGDANYEGSTSACEPFTVSQGPTTTTTALFTSTGTPIPLGSSVPLATQVHDLATVGPAVSPFPITGTVEYFFSTSGCGGTFTLFDTQPVGTASINTNALAAGSYAFYAVYSGDANYGGSTSDCEPFPVSQGPTTTTTALFASDGTSIPLGGTATLGTMVHDLATVGPSVPPFPITGTVEYFFSTTGCAGTFTLFDTQPVGTASINTNALAAGSYAFYAVYSGDANYGGSTSGCEPFTIPLFPPSSTTTALFTSAGVSIPLHGSVALGTSVYDVATVGTEVGGFAITGTVDFSFFSSGDCSGTPSVEANVALTRVSPNSVATSSTHGPLSAGSYSFQAAYSGDPNYLPTTSECEPFTVNQAPTTISTTLHNALGGGVIVVGSTLPFGASVYDTADVAGQVGAIPITGTVTFSFFTNGACSGTPAFTETVPLGTQSTTQGPLNNDGYSFQATYNGDGNYQASTSSCESFSVTAPPHVTDTSFCPIPTTGFRLIFIQNTGSTYTLTASNPGQFYSNVFTTLPAGGSLSVTMSIPYPFVTQGANPIQVFYNQPIPSCGSSVPPSNVNGEFTISRTSIALADYGSAPVMGVSTVQVTFTSQVTLPAGLYWFAIHLNYGLKGFDFQKIPKGSGACTSANAGDCAQGTASYNFIANPQSYAFSDSVYGANPITSVNKFNKDPGFAGVVTDGTGTPIPNVPVTIVLSGKKLATVYTDANGVYLYEYKYTGSAAPYTVTAIYNGATKSASGLIKSNAMIVTNFQFP